MANSNAAAQDGSRIPNPLLARVCIDIAQMLDNNPPPHLRRCDVLFTTLYLLNRGHPELKVPSYWFRDGVVADPATLTEQTGGIIQFRRDEQCAGCQIEHECPAVVDTNKEQEESP